VPHRDSEPSSWMGYAVLRGRMSMVVLSQSLRRSCTGSAKNLHLCRDAVRYPIFIRFIEL
jgi:hypothetical protein